MRSGVRPRDMSCDDGAYRVIVTAFMRYRPPGQPWLDVGETPRLESFNASSNPAHIALQAYLDRLERLLHDHLPDLTTPVSLGLAVGVAPAEPLLKHRDLDNYLAPIARRIHRTGRRIVSAHASKAHAAGSSIAVDIARPSAEAGDGRVWVADLHVSYEKPAYKEAIRDTVSDGGELPDGPVAVEISFVVSPERNWLSLWKPTIDALGPLLGHAPGAAEWNARDGRITQLALHCAYDPAQKWNVAIAISARPHLTSRHPSSH